MKTNLLQLGTQGVDMKSNPLLLGNKKLHAATNLMFDEGVLRTRYGFRYESLGAEGQFQGACEYRPQEGISATVLSESESGIAVVADGVLWFNCNPISESLFDCAGSVHLYQAENYLILQNPVSDTFWWDGVGELVRSPGMNEQDWNDPEVPVFEMEVVAPEAAIPDCDIDGSESGIEVRFLVIDSVTEQPIPDVTWTVKRNGSRAYDGISGDDGRFVFKPVPRVYAYDLRKDGYTAIEDIPLEINGTGVERVWDDCMPPTIEIVGEYDFVVRMVPITSEYPAVLVLVLDQTGSIGAGGAARGIEIIDNTDVQAIGYVSFGDSICQTRAVTTDLAAVRAELVTAVENPDLPPFFCDGGGNTPENGVDALAAGLALLTAFTDLPSGERAIFFKTDTLGYSTPSNDPATVNAGLNNVDYVWLEFGEDTDDTEVGLYADTFPETSVVSHSTFPLIVP